MAGTKRGPEKETAKNRKKMGTIKTATMAAGKPRKAGLKNVGSIEGFQPSAGDIARRRETKDELTKFRGHPEELVRKRTADLQKTNENLQKEIIALRQEGEHTRHLASFPQMNPNPVMEVDSAGYVLFANPAAYAVLENLGLKKDDVGRLLPADMGDILEGMQGKSNRSFSREVIIGDSVIGETINLVPQLGVARIYGRDITDHKRAREALQQSEERFRLIAETSADVIFQLDVEGRITYCSPAVRSFGYSPDGIFGRSFSEFIAHDDLSKAAEAFQRVNLGERLSLFEIRVLKADGSTATVEFSGTPIVKDGAIVGTQGIVRDISERKRIEVALRESEERLRLAQQASKIGAFEWNIQTGVNVWTPELEAMYGLAPGEFGKTQPAWEHLVHPEDRATAVALVDRAFETGEPISGEWRVVWRDGSVHWIQGRFQLYKDGAGRPVRLTGVNLDITERKRSEEKLRQSEERQRLAIAATNLGTWDYNPITGALNWDSRCKELFGLPPEASVDYDAFLAGLHPGDRERIHQVVQATFDPASGGNYEAEYRTVGLQDGGVLRWIRATGRAFFDEAGQAIRFIGTVQDITERQQTEEDLRRAQEVAGIGSWRLDVQKNTLTWSDETRRIFGAPGGTLLTYETFLSNVHPDDREYVDTKWKAALRGGGYDIEHRIIVDGTVKWVKEKAYLEFAENGSLLGGFGITQDITERRLVLEEIRRAKEGLERRVVERTAELVQSNRRLEEEIAERIETEKHLTAINSLLKLFGSTFRRKGYLEAVVNLLKTQCECECIGIRLIDEHGNIPYSASSGLSRDFLDEEDCLSLGKDTCACTRIAREKPSRAEAALITPAGSFICNDTSRLQNPSKRGSSARYRSACLQQGFGSVAVIAIRYRNKVLGVIHLADRRQGKFSRQIVELIEAATPLIGEALYRFNIEEALVSSRERLRSLSSYLVTAREEERLRVAREIHDELGQTLTGARMELAMLKKVRGKRDAVEQKISSVMELIDNSIEDIHRICAELRPRVLDHLGLKAAIEWQAKKFMEWGGLNCFLDLPHGQISLPSSVATSVFRIFQETLTNIARHAKASNVNIRLGIEDTVMLLEIEDDGKGIPAHRISGKDSFGLIGIRERVHQLGGKVTFKGVKGKGTTVTVTIPLSKKSDVSHSY